MSELKYKIAQNYFEPKHFGSVKVYQIGRAHCGSGTVITAHSQRNYYEFTVVTGGKGINVTDGVRIPVEKGDIYISFEGDFHEIISDYDDPLKYDFLTVHTDAPEILGGLEELKEKNHDADARIVRDERITKLVSDAISEMNEDGEYKDTIMESIIKQIFIYFIRDMKSKGHIPRTEGVSGAAITCFKIMNYIDNHIYSMKDLGELSEITNYNYNYISNLFKKITGITLRDYYKNRRLETARLLISSGEASVTDAAELLGYSSLYSFSTAFKKRYGISPGAAKKEKTELHRQNNDCTGHLFGFVCDNLCSITIEFFLDLV